MNEKAGRYTVAYESKAFPYFTINFEPRHELEPPCSEQDIMAYCNRQRILSKYRHVIRDFGIVVNSDCQFEARDEQDALVIRSFARLCLDCRMERVEHEAL